jgi:hypothetical protein
MGVIGQHLTEETSFPENVKRTPCRTIGPGMSRFVHPPTVLGRAAPGRGASRVAGRVIRTTKSA